MEYLHYAAIVVGYGLLALVGLVSLVFLYGFLQFCYELVLLRYLRLKSSRLDLEISRLQQTLNERMSKAE